MRILLVNNLYPPFSRGGAESAVVNETRELHAAGHEVTVLTTAPGFRHLIPRESDEDGIRMVRFFPLNLFWYRNDHRHTAPVRALWHLFAVNNWHANRVLRKLVRAWKPDAVHLHNINGISYAYPRICDRLGARTVFTVHAVHYAVPSGVIIRGRSIPRLFTPFAALMRRMLRTDAVVTAPSRWLLDFYLSRGFFKGQRLAVIPNPISEVRTDARVARNGGPPAARTARTKLATRGSTDGGVPGQDPSVAAPLRFLYVGQLEPYKGIHVMLAALLSLSPALRWQLDIVGDGSLSGDLRKQRDQRVRIRGKLGGTELADAYASSDALIMPSLCEENAPMVIAEAGAHGLPVIASEIGGIPEMVRDGETGILFAPGNVEELALQCGRILERPEILAPFAAAAKENAGRYAPAFVAGEFLKLFSVTSSSSRSAP